MDYIYKLFGFSNPDKINSFKKPEGYKNLNSSQLLKQK